MDKQTAQACTEKPKTKMAKYKRHGEVYASKIRLMIPNSNNTECRLIFEEMEYPEVTVSLEFMHKHAPDIGDYYMHDEYGNVRIIHPRLFEDTHTKI